MMTRKAIYRTPPGFSDMVMECDGEMLTGLHFADSRKASEACRGSMERDLPAFRETRRWLDEYLVDASPTSRRYIVSTD